MSVYVDPLQNFGWKLRGRLVRSCHMVADTLDELHSMATKIGMKRLWFQDAVSAQHYDLVESRRQLAVSLGAIELDRTAFVAVIRRLRETRCLAP